MSCHSTTACSGSSLGLSTSDLRDTVMCLATFIRHLLGEGGYGCPYRTLSLLEKINYKHKEHCYRAWTNQNSVCMQQNYVWCVCTKCTHLWKPEGDTEYLLASPSDYLGQGLLLHLELIHCLDRLARESREPVYTDMGCHTRPLCGCWGCTLLMVVQQVLSPLAISPSSTNVPASIHTPPVFLNELLVFIPMVIHVANLYKWDTVQ